MSGSIFQVFATVLSDFNVNKYILCQVTGNAIINVQSSVKHVLKFKNTSKSLYVYDTSSDLFFVLFFLVVVVFLGGESFVFFGFYSYSLTSLFLMKDNQVCQHTSLLSLALKPLCLTLELPTKSITSTLLPKQFFFFNDQNQRSINQMLLNFL